MLHILNKEVPFESATISSHEYTLQPDLSSNDHLLPSLTYLRIKLPEKIKLEIFIVQILNLVTTLSHQVCGQDDGQVSQQPPVIHLIYSLLGYYGIRLRDSQS